MLGLRLFYTRRLSSTLSKKMKSFARIAALCISTLLFACERRPQPDAQSEAEVRDKQSIPTDLTKLEQEFIEALKKAFAEGSAEPLVARICWDGVPKMLHDSMDDYLVDGVARGVQSFELSRVDPEEYTERTEGDTKVKANLPVQWILVVYHPSEGGVEISSEYLLGERDDTIQFTNAIAK